MSNYDELVKALRWCAKPIPCSKTECPRKNTDEDCACHVLQDAAAAIEALEAEVKRLKAENPIVETVLVDKMRQQMEVQE